MKVIKLWASWCQPCKVLSRNLEEFNVCPLEEVNVDENQSILAKYGLRNIPALIIEKNGEVLDKIVGVISKEELENRVNAFN